MGPKHVSTASPYVDNEPKPESQVSQELVGRIVSGDKSAETEMVQRYQRGLQVMLVNRSKDKYLAEDITQETWALVLGKLRKDELRNPERLAAFIIQIGKNQLIMHYRKQGKQRISDDSDLNSIESSDASPEQLIINQQLGDMMQEVLTELGQARDREVIKEFYLLGKDKAQLCEQFEISPAHFDRVLYRAKERFKKLWLAKGMRRENSNGYII